ncbi:hypothetical protein GJAV_G00027100 [Gymnothorax javanicus]|nr:hypothetical protein GJAV_G00027100 [Gymnothorax javanicus]
MKQMSWKMSVITKAFLLYLTFCVFKVRMAGKMEDACAACHVNATCDDKMDGSGGKVCNCMYGFLGNGRTQCQDKNECQIGDGKICGEHTVCHNTYGSFYCTCLRGYSSSNNLVIFIPNDGTQCNDIDECKVQGICGEGGWCTNVQGDFNCRCQTGYKVLNGSQPFHPHRDKAFCKAIDCGQPPTVTNSARLLGTGTRYGSVVEFGCLEGFFQKSGNNTAVCSEKGIWEGLSLECEEIDCGEPPALPHSVMTWNKHSTVGTKAHYKCSPGFHNTGNGTISVCNASGQWEKASIQCKEIKCGDPPMLPHSGQVWNGSSKLGSTVTYYCIEGFYQAQGESVSFCVGNGYWTKPTLWCKETRCGQPPEIQNLVKQWDGSTAVGSISYYSCPEGFHKVKGSKESVCTVNGQWQNVTLKCEETDCGDPPYFPHSILMRINSTKIGTKVSYQCEAGFYNAGNGNDSVCAVNGYWRHANILCQEINCGPPTVFPNTDMYWDNTTKLGSVVHYTCKHGFYLESGSTCSTCTSDREWEHITVTCKEINCGPPAVFPNTDMHWDNTTTLGSVVNYTCKHGFYLDGRTTQASCTSDRVWEHITVTCKARCGPPPSLPHADVEMWNGSSAGSVARHRCQSGYRRWSGQDLSVCTDTGRWQSATLLCREIKPAISKLVVFNERCLRWRAERYKGQGEQYTVQTVGSRDYQRTFRDVRQRAYSSAADRPELCLTLLPGTNYTINITAVSARFSSITSASTSILAPPAPEVVYKDVEVPLPSLFLRRSVHTLDPISVYQVFVVPLEGRVVFNCRLAKELHFQSQSPTRLYMAAQLRVVDIGRELSFTLGDQRNYGNYFNAPLQPGRDYYIILRAVNQWGGVRKQSCVFWAKARGTSYLIKSATMITGGLIGLVAFVIFLGFTHQWYCKKK